jgi:hypothetical protein
VHASDPAAAAHAEQEALATLWRVVYSSSLTWDSRVRRLNTALTILGAINFAIVVALFQGCWDDRTLRFMLEQHCAAYTPLQFLAQFAYAAFLAVLCWYYYEKAGYHALHSHFPSRWSAFIHCGLRAGFLWELLASLVQPFPILYLLIDLKHSQYLVILALLAKLYLVLRLLRDYSEVYQRRMFIKQHSQFDRSYFAMDWLTIAKTYVYHYTTSDGNAHKHATTAHASCFLSDGRIVRILTVLLFFFFCCCCALFAALCS